MGVTETLGVGDLFSSGASSGGGFVSSLNIFLIIFLCLVGVGVFIFAYVYYKNQKAQFKYTVNLFKEVNGKNYWVASDKAKELKIPGTNVRIFFWQRSKLYSAYPTREMGLNVYAYKINRFGELTNFDLKESDDPNVAKIDYDHRDQTYAYLHLQKLIDRNYRDKTKVWWKENLPLITVIITTVLLLIAMWFFFRMSGNQVAQWTAISENMKEAARIMADGVSSAKNMNAGVV